MSGEDSCVICGQPAAHRHHVTGRGANGDHLHEQLTTPLCRRDHGLVHEDLRHQQVDSPPDRALNALEAIERCLRRLALLLARIAERRPEPTWVALLHAVAGWADGLDTAIAGLDRDTPGWRDIPEVSP